MKIQVTIRSFTRDETNFLKGVAILLIALHNFYRWVNPITGENEFWFDPLAIIKSWIFVRNNPLELIHVFFNFLGHYGVQAFIVISAYGLTRSYRKSRPGYAGFIGHRVDKLYPSLLLAGIVFIIFTLISTGKLIDLNTLGNLGIQFTLFANLVPGKAMVITGPWWFYSFIFQFYLVFPLLMWIHRKSGWGGLAGLAIAGYLFTILMYQPMLSADLNPYMTFMGHLPEFCLGIFLASRDEVKMPWWVILFALLVLIGGNIYRWLWPFANLAVAILLVVSIQGLIRLKPGIKPAYALISAIGVISMYLFAVHGFMRSPFINLANAIANPMASLMIAILFVAVASGVAALLMHTETAARQWISGGREGKGSGLTGRGLGKTMVLLFVVAGGFSLLFFLNYRHLDAKQELIETVVFEASHDFEQQVPGRSDILSDTIARQGGKSLLLDNNHAFSPGFVVDLDTLRAGSLSELELSAWLFATGNDGALHLVMEIWDKTSGKQIEWQSEYIRPGTYPPGEWFAKTFRYPVRPEYRMPTYRFRVYAWKPSAGDWYVDDLVIRIKGLSLPQ